MCGIWARTRFQARVEPEELLHPVGALSHRGPDSYGWYADDHVALVHTRLSIIDLNGGAQPLTSFDGRWIGIVNGELYDFEAIRTSLEKDGVSFQTRSDSEVLLNLYAARGAKALEGISGEFAFIFYDRKHGRLCFGRDPFGVKPLFMDRSRGVFTLASEMKALSDAAPEIDPVYLKTFLAHAVVPPRTFLKDVEHVWPGRVYDLDLRTRDLKWTNYAPSPFFQKRDLKGPEAVEALEAALKGAVRRRMRADVEVGCYLSGGIDSALVAALIADSGARCRAFTVGFADRTFDETEQAARIAKDLGLKHSVVQLSKRNFMPSLIRSIVAFENPITNPHGAAKNLLSAHAGESVKVVLSGEGSDELLGGYAYLRMRKLQDFVAKHPRFAKGAAQNFLARETGRNLGHLDGSSTAFASLAAEFFEGQSPMLFGRITRRRWYNYLTDESLDPLLRGLCSDLSSRLREEHSNASLSGWDLDMWMGARTDLLHYVLSNVGDRQEMAHSLEGRTPFLDPEVARVAGRISEGSLLRGLREKHVLREVGRKYLRREDSGRGKKPFFAPLKYLYLRENRATVDGYIDAARKVTPWLNWRDVDRALALGARSPNSPLQDHVASLKMTLFSTGVLTTHLREAPSTPPRGFRLPKAAEDLRPFRRYMD